ncbi:unnamed protein product [Paramecium pentaurelia]|uniref:Uncharacterized protein n=1 Tax=Paramecium pentaurelia TaxID=43138 RepID=A0A8S1WAF2_9CILI|nr:unnamed protein product [Paramecium pentaurelia]
MGNNCCECCIKKNQKDNNYDANEKEIEQTVDYKIQKGPTHINVLYKNLQTSNCIVYVSCCDEKGRNSQNSLLQKNEQVAEQLLKKNNQIGQLSEITIGKVFFFFFVLPLYLGEEQQILLLKQQIKQFAQIIIDRNLTEIAIEDIGVQRFGYPRQLVAKLIIETFANQLHKMVSLNRIDFMINDLKSKFLFEEEIQARREILLKGDSLLKIDQTDEKSLKQPLMI